MTRTCLPLAALLTLGAGCGGAEPAPTPAGDASPPAAAPDPLAPLDTLAAADLAGCGIPYLPEDGPVYVAGRVEAEGAEFLHLAWRTDGTLSNNTVRRSGGTCEPFPFYAAEDEGAWTPGWGPVRALYGDPLVFAREAAVAIEAAGGLDSLRAAPWVRRARECVPGEVVENDGCFPAPRAEGYRMAGVPVAQPPWTSSEDLEGATTDLSAVPDSLQACVPRALRFDDGVLEFVGSMLDGPDRLFLFELFEPEPEKAVYSTHPSGVRQRADGTCLALDPLNSDAFSRETVALMNAPDVARRSAEIHVERAGGLDAYLGILKRNGTTLHVCGPAQIPADHQCMTETDADAYRAAGVPVGPPRTI